MGTKKLHQMVHIALMATVLCVISPIALPVGISPVPVSLCSLAVCLFSCILPVHAAVTGTAVYLLIGLVGLPVFALGQGGIGVLLGPTGGYLIGYLFLSGICAYFSRKKTAGLRFFGMLLGTAVLYLFGTLWYCAVCGVSFAAGGAVCVLPYLPGDGIKLLLAMVFAPLVQNALRRSGVKI